MPQLTLAIPHTLGLDEAARRLKEKLTAARAEHRDRLTDFREEWREHNLSFAFKALGMAISGTVAVERECVKLAATIPLSVMFFKGAIEDRIRKEVGILLAPGNPPDDTNPPGSQSS
jgi:predicted NBD/HSP70 family sugar kinase